MNRFVKSLTATIVGLLIFVGSLTRFHHHDEDFKVCCCLIELVGNHFNNDHSDCDHRHTEGDGSSCPLHIDYFKISEPLDKVAMHFCCHHLCDLCAPVIHYPLNEWMPTAYNHQLDILSPSGGHMRCATHRGPPAQSLV